MVSMRSRGFPRQTAACVLLALTLLVGCVPDAKYQEVIGDYQQASATLGQAADALFLNANRVEAENYILKQSAAGDLLAQDDIDKQILLSPEGLALRRQAITALSEYTTALAALASGKTEDQIAADAATAGASVAQLTTDVQAAVMKDSATANTASWSGPVSAAVSAAGEIIQLIEKHRSRVELKANLEKNDPAVKALFALVARDADFFYARQRQQVGLRGVVLYATYQKERTAEPAASAYELLQLGERIQQFRRDREMIALSDPKPAFDAWKQSHDELVAVLLKPDKKQQKESLGQVLADVEAFAATVSPLAANLRTLIAGV